MAVSRRSVLGAAVLTSIGCRAAAQAPVAAALIAQRAGHVPRIAARTIRNGWGVADSIDDGTSMDDHASMLGQIGTRDLRLTITQFGQSAVPGIQALARAMRAVGISQPKPRVTALVNAYMHDKLTTWELQQKALLALAGTGMLQAIEGPNELNARIGGVVGTHGPNDTVDRSGADEFAANYLAWCEALARFKQDNKALGTVTTISPSLVISPPATFQKLPNVSHIVDAGNLHYYAGGGLQPNLSLRFNPFVGTFQNTLHWAKVTEMAGGPVWLTECGATTSNIYARDGISQAKYVANQIFNYFAAEDRHMFIYRLTDGSSNPGDAEGNFGLFHRDGTPKPAARMLRGLQDLLSLGSYDDPSNASDSGPVPNAFSPQGLIVPGLTGPNPDDPSCVVLPKTDGSTLIVLWNEPSIDDGKGHDMVPANRSIALDFGSAQRFAVHDLMDADLQSGMAARRGRASTGRGADIVLRGYPLVIELMAPGRR